jgi:hypothetical protein
MCRNGSSPVKRKVIIRISLTDVPQRTAQGIIGSMRALLLLNWGTVAAVIPGFAFSARRGDSLCGSRHSFSKFTIAHARPRVVEY